MSLPHDSWHIYLPAASVLQSHPQVLWGHSMDWIPPSSFTWKRMILAATTATTKFHLLRPEIKQNKRQVLFCYLQGRQRAVKKWTGVEQGAFIGAARAEQPIKPALSASCFGASLSQWSLSPAHHTPHQQPRRPPTPACQSHPGDFPWRQARITVITQRPPLRPNSGGP